MNGFVSFADKFYTYVVIENVGPRNIRCFLFFFSFSSFRTCFFSNFFFSPQNGASDQLVQGPYTICSFRSNVQLFLFQFNVESSFGNAWVIWIALAVERELVSRSELEHKDDSNWLLFYCSNFDSLLVSSIHHHFSALQRSRVCHCIGCRHLCVRNCFDDGE